MVINKKFEEISKKVGLEFSSLELVDYVSHVALPPSYFGKISEAVATVLQNLLQKYSQTLNGMPLAYNRKNVQLLSSVGKIVSDQAFVHFDVETELVIFKPAAGDTIQAKIHRLKKKGQLSCLIHDYIYAFVFYSISESDPEPQVGDTVLFNVTKVENDGMGVLSIKGVLHKIVESKVSSIDPSAVQAAPADFDSGIDDDTLSKSVSTGELTPRSVTEETVAAPEVVANAQNLIQEQDDTDEKKKLKKKKKEKKAKKDRKREHSPNVQEEASTSLLPVGDDIVSKKKKAKKEKKKKKERDETKSNVEPEAHAKESAPNPDTTSSPKKKKKKKEKKHVKELEKVSVTGTLESKVSDTGDNQNIVDSSNVSQPLIITDVRSLKADEAVIDLTSNSTSTTSVRRSTMKESSGGFVSVSQSSSADESSLRSWLNAGAVPEARDEDIDNLLTFTKKGVKRKHSETITEHHDLNNAEKSSSAVRSNVHLVDPSSALTIILSDDEKPKKPKLKRIKLDQNVSKPDSKLLNSNLPTDREQTTVQKESSDASCKVSTVDDNLSPFTASSTLPSNKSDAIAQKLNEIIDLSDESMQKDIKKDFVSFIPEKLVAEETTSITANTTSSCSFSKEEMPILKTVEKEKKRKQKEERKKVKEETRALSAKQKEDGFIKSDEKTISYLHNPDDPGEVASSSNVLNNSSDFNKKLMKKIEKEERRKQKEEKRKQKDERKKQKEERRKIKEEKRALKAEKREQKQAKKKAREEKRRLKEEKRKAKEQLKSVENK